MPKIAHIADTHIRNLKYHSEYRDVFDHLYHTLTTNKPDIIIHCGDIAHTKTQLSPEYFAMASDFLYNLAEIAPTYLILGNHDGNLKNSSRQDAITPIVNALSHKNLHLLKKSGETEPIPGIVLNVLSVFDRENWIEPTDTNKINIALYHGAICGSKTATGWSLDHGEDDVTIFDSFDFAMLGDIHSPQALDMHGRIRYAGSTIQQNFGEAVDKGYLLWDIKNKQDWRTIQVTLPHPRPFVTIVLDKSGNISKQSHIPKDCRLRLVSSSNLPIDKIRKVTDVAKLKYSPHSISFLNKGSEIYSEEEKKSIKMENLRSIKVQEKWIRKYLGDYELGDELLQEIFGLNNKYNRLAEAKEEISRNVVWKIKEMEWKNLFNYGGGNRINFDKLNGLVGIFGKNYSGKSSIIDSALFGLYNTTSKEERKNVHIINQNKNKSSIKLAISTENTDYQICRNLNRYTKKLKGKETVEAKTDLDFMNVTTGESLNGDTRNETDANIRRVFGTIDDFMITSMTSQNDSLSFIREGSTKRKEILAKFLDLEIFDQKFKMAKKDSADIAVILRRLKQKDITTLITKSKEKLDTVVSEIEHQTTQCIELERQKTRLDKEMAQILADIQQIPAEIIDIEAVNSSIIVKENEVSVLTDTRGSIITEGAKNIEIIEEIEKFCVDYDMIRLEHLRMKHQEYIEDAKVINNKLSASKLRQQSLEKKVELLDGIPCGNQFPNCKFICDANKANPELEKTKDKIDDLATALDDAGDKLVALNIEDINRKIEKYLSLMSRKQELETALDKYDLTLENNKSKIDLLSNEIESLKAKQAEYNENKHIIENLETLNREKKGILASLQKIGTQIDSCNNSLQSLLIEQGSEQQSLSRLSKEQKEYEDLNQQWAAYDLFMRCMHPNGIAYEVIKQKLPLINEEVAKILTNIVEFDVIFENNDKKLDIFIKHPRYEPRPLSMGSGAEKTIAAMAIRLGLISITNLPKSELFILDEPATALDQEHMEGFIRLLDMIKSQFKTVLLISHLEVLKDAVDTTIDIEQVKGYAKVNLK